MLVRFYENKKKYTKRCFSVFGFFTLHKCFISVASDICLTGYLMLYAISDTVRMNKKSVCKLIYWISQTNLASKDEKKLPLLVKRRINYMYAWLLPCRIKNILYTELVTSKSAICLDNLGVNCMLEHQCDKFVRKIWWTC